MVNISSVLPQIYTFTVTEMLKVAEISKNVFFIKGLKRNFHWLTDEFINNTNSQTGEFMLLFYVQFLRKPRMAIRAITFNALSQNRKLIYIVISRRQTADNLSQLHQIIRVETINCL